MGRINELDFHVANLIAAGEVVERPASVVKELLENALDSGADSITVEIQNGGISFIRVSDNGCGMEPEDVPVSIKRHATSKIQNAEDLASINTLGFRGEALAAIASVSRLRIMTKTQNSTSGTLLEAENGTIISSAEVGCPDGTTVIVEELFANVPARFKFLKRNVTEAMAVTSVVEKIALSRPDIRLTYLIDGETRLSTAGDGNFISASWSVLGSDFAKRTVKIEAQDEGFSIDGLIGSSENVRSNRNLQLFFINNRYVRSRTISAALEQAFSSYIPSDKFPCCVMYITINPRLVDVNVHPAKLEVKFSNEKRIFEAVFYAVRNALALQSRPERAFSAPKAKSGANPAVAFVPVLEREERKREDMRISLEKATPKDSFTQTDSKPHCAVHAPSAAASKFTMGDLDMIKSLSNTLRASDLPKKEDHKFTVEADDASLPDFPAVTPKDPVEEKNKAKEAPPLREYTIVGELFFTYVIAEFKDKVVFVDKHAAHERILYERLRAEIPQSDSYAKILLVPIGVPACADDLEIIEEYRVQLENAGYRFEVADDKSAISLLQIPSYIDDADAAGLFAEMFSSLGGGKRDERVWRNLVFERALYTVACKAAVKGGRDYGIDELYCICDELFSLDNVKVCPHGRPVAFEMTKKDFDNQFGR